MTYNKVNTHGWYKKPVSDLYEADYVPDSFENAMAMAGEWEDRLTARVVTVILSFQTAIMQNVGGLFNINYNI